MLHKPSTRKLHFMPMHTEKYQKSDVLIQIISHAILT